MAPARIAVALAALAVAASSAATLQAQAVPFSQRAVVTQWFGNTEVTVRYSRPNTRGRVLFGRLVPWGRPWNPGADSATAISISHAVTVEGTRLPPGSYSLWFVPDSTGPWTIVFSRAAQVFHAPYPGDEHDLARLTVHPARGEATESLEWHFPEARATDGVLSFRWGTTRLDLRLTVVPD